MSILSELKEILSSLEIPIETGVFSDTPPDEYLVLTPITDELNYFADDFPQYEVSEVRISLFTKSNYTQIKSQITELLLRSDFIITERRYIGHEDDTGYHHYVIDVEKCYENGGI